MKDVARQEIQRLFAQYIAEKNGLTVEEATARIADGTYPRAHKRAKKKKAPAPVQAKAKKKPLTTAQRIARRLRAEGGRRGSPTVQGGAPDWASDGKEKKRVLFGRSLGGLQQIRAQVWG